MPEGADASTWRRVAGSMRARITIAASLVTAVAVALAGWLVIRSVEQTQVGRINDETEARVEAVAARLRAGATWDDAVMDQIPVQIVDANGQLVGSNPTTVYDAMGNPIPRPLVSDPGAAGVLDGPAVGGRSVASQMEAPFIDAETMVAIGNGTARLEVNGREADIFQREVDTDRYGEVRVLAAGYVDEVARSVDAVTKALWLLLPGLVGVVALVAWWLAGRTLRPVEAIRVQAESIGGSTIDRRLPEPAGDDEIGRLARTMNAMLERLEDSAVRQRQFVSDASHELRSPVAAIRTDLEVALHEGDAADWPTVARAVLAEESRLETLLGDLLVLASDDEAAAAAHTSMVDLVHLAADEAARGRRVPVTLDAPDAVDPEAFVVAGVAARLDRALANLVDNGARHARSEVRVAVTRHGARVRVVVDDDGPGIPAIDRERIFERFTRLDASRARHQGGAGLGLAVVRSIVARHGGYVWADKSPSGGARFTFELPAAHP